jgi:hypothetical protein
VVWHHEGSYQLVEFKWVEAGKAWYIKRVTDDNMERVMIAVRANRVTALREREKMT